MEMPSRKFDDSVHGTRR